MCGAEGGEYSLGPILLARFSFSPGFNRVTHAAFLVFNRFNGF
jgi:hypothetical protein